MQDSLTRFSIDNSNITGALVQLTQSHHEMTTQQGDQSDYPLYVQHLLAEMATVALFMASNLKVAGRLTLQLYGSGHLYSAFVEVELCQQTIDTGSERAIRGLARRHETQVPMSLDLRDWLGDQARLAITVQPNKGRPYQGITPIEQPRFSQCIEDYYQRSEQLPTQLWIQQDRQRCAALFLQSLPERKTVAPALLWQEALLYAQTLKPDELLQYTPMILLERLFNEYRLRVHSATPVAYRCSCTEQRSEAALVALGPKELKAMAAEQATVTLDCQFCSKHYTFAIDTLLATLDKQ